jgi:hypothetical protein
MLKEIDKEDGSKIYTAEISNSELGIERTIEGRHAFIVEAIADSLKASFEKHAEEWLLASQIAGVKKGIAETRGEWDVWAEHLTSDAKKEIEKYAGVLRYGIDNYKPLVWENLKSKAVFRTQRPDEPKLNPTPKEPEGEIPHEPKENGEKYKVEGGGLFKGLKEKQAKARWKKDYDEWEAKVRELDETKKRYLENLKVWETKRDEVMGEYDERLKKWEEKHARFQEEVVERNEIIDKLKLKYSSGNAEGVEAYAEMVMGMSDYPVEFPQAYGFEYLENTKHLKVKCELPGIEKMPLVKEVRQVGNGQEMEGVKLTDVERAELWERMKCGTGLRCCFEIFESDNDAVIESVEFTGISGGEKVIEFEASRRGFEVWNVDVVEYVRWLSQGK